MEANEDLGSIPSAEASLRLQVTDLLLGRPWEGRPGLMQGDVLQQIEAALEAYGSYFYPPERR